MFRFALPLLLVLASGCQRSEPVVAAETPAPAPVAVDVPAAANVPVAGADTRPEPDSAFVLPGDYTQYTTVAELQARFGAANVVIDESPQDDGSVRRSLILFPDDPSRRAYVDFHDSQALTDVASISVRDAGSVWRGKQGVRVGMTLAELRAANDWPFNFSGFDEEGRAWVRDQWSPALGDEYRLGRLDVGEGEHMYFGVDLGLKAPAEGLPPTDWPHDDYVSSDDPKYPRLGEIVEVTAIVASTSLDDEWD